MHDVRCTMYASLIYGATSNIGQSYIVHLTSYTLYQPDSLLLVKQLLIESTLLLTGCFPRRHSMLNDTGK
jgi:hypothetical protein